MDRKGDKYLRTIIKTQKDMIVSICSIQAFLCHRNEELNDAYQRWGSLGRIKECGKISYQRQF